MEGCLMSYDKTYKIKPRSTVEKLVVDFVVKNKLYATYGKDTDGIFEVKFIVNEEDNSND
jgi:hypothetical protein